MKLLTHNFLSSRFLKNVQTGYPLILSSSGKEEKEVEFDIDFVKNMIPKVDYTSLRTAAIAIGEGSNLPDSLPDNWEDDEQLLKELHRIMLGIEIVSGELKCPESGRVFIIKDGIPNMLCNEDEVD